MGAEIRIYLPNKFLDSFRDKGHLALFDRIDAYARARGGRVRTVQRDQRMLSAQGGWDAQFDDGNLHIIENGVVRAKNVLNAAIAYIPPYWHLEPGGVLFDSPIANLAFDAGGVDPAKAEAFVQGLRQRLVEKRRSRYLQPRAHEDIPEGAIAVFLQGDTPVQQGAAHCTTEEMLRSVCAHAGGRPVVVKPHPLGRRLRDVETITAVLRDGYEVYPTEANIHDILARCAVTVSFNSAVAMEGFLHGKPAILFGRADFHHIAQTVTRAEQFPAALARALNTDVPFAAFLFWYFRVNGFSVKAPDFEQKLQAKFDAAGFSAERLGLTA